MSVLINLFYRKCLIKYLYKIFFLCYLNVPGESLSRYKYRVGRLICKVVGAKLTKARGRPVAGAGARGRGGVHPLQVGTNAGRHEHAFLSILSVIPTMRMTLYAKDILNVTAIFTQ